MPVVTISRQFGAGGHTLGKIIAERFGYQLVDRDIVAQVAKEANVSVGWVEAVEHDAGGLLVRIANRLVSSDFIERILGDTGSDFDQNKYVQFITKIISNLADEGNVLIVGRGSQFILDQNEQIIKVLLVAELEDRIKFMMEHYDLTKSKAEQLVRKEEKRRCSFLKLFDETNPDASDIYSLVLNTSRVSLKEAEDIIADLILKVVDEYAAPIW